MRIEKNRLFPTTNEIEKMHQIQDEKAKLILLEHEIEICRRIINHYEELKDIFEDMYKQTTPSNTKKVLREGMSLCKKYQSKENAVLIKIGEKEKEINKTIKKLERR